MPLRALTPSESPFEATELEQLVGDQIDVLGDDNVFVRDRYNPSALDDRDYDRKHLTDGQFIFGGLWRTQHSTLDLGKFTVVYADKPASVYVPGDHLLGAEAEQPDEEPSQPLSPAAEFIVYEFCESGVRARTTFREVRGEGEFAGKIIKLRVSSFGADLTDLCRPINNGEADRLRAVVADPQANVVALGGLAGLAGRDKSIVKKL